MTNLGFYGSTLGATSLDELVSLFCDTVVETNRTYDFFVDWEKVFINRDKHRNELALLSSLKGIKNPKEHLRELIDRYPEVVRAFPLLLADRHEEIKVLHSMTSGFQYMIYSFKGGGYGKAEIDMLVQFCEKTGLLNALSGMESPIDYATGVEVGLDSNARKNRSGDFMELVVDEVLSVIEARNGGLKRIRQKTFKFVEREFSILIPPGLKERKFDEVTLLGKSGINIEMNFYGGTGSKPTEMVDSYINRSRELSSIGWEFILVTDGIGWRKMTNQLRKAFENLPYVFNLKMIQEGLLEKIISRK